MVKSKMGIIEDIDYMRRQGSTDTDIMSGLKQRGYSDKDISGAFSQSKIKDAVHADPVEAPVQEYNEMSPSLMSTETQTAETARQETVDQQETAAQQTAQTSYAEYPSYSQQPSYDNTQYSGSNVGTDIITEIADQVVAEKISPILNALDKILDMKSSTESQLKYMDERIKRIEKIIDHLQLSVLQKVGEYMSNVEDIKQEMQETQKTFKSLVDKR